MNDTDLSLALMLDGNSAAGLLMDVFGVEVTASPAECAHCGRQGAVGALLAFGQGPGVVLRCPACKGIVLRISKTRDRYYLDARGAAFICLPA